MSAPATVCRSCKAPIIWVISPRGRRLPLDLKPLPVYRLHSRGNGDPDVAARLEFPVYRSHFETCPDAGDWSGKGKSS